MATLPIDDIQADVAGVFLSYFQRAPEFEAMQWYADLYIQLLAAQGDDPAAEDNAFKELSAQIYADGAASGEVPQGPTVTDSWYVNYLYQNVLGRVPDAEGLAYWVGELEAGNIARPELVSILLAAAVDGGGRDADYVLNRVQVAVEFSQWQNSNPEILPTLRYDATEVMIGVNETEASVVMAEQKLYTTTGQDGDTFTLTPGIDTFMGTTLNDVFNAFSVNPNTGAAANTLTSFDNLNGDEGIDTLNIYSDGTLNSTVPGNATIRNIEIVNVFHEDADTPAAGLTNAARYQGVQQLWQIGGVAAVTHLGADTVAGYRDTQGEFAASIMAAASARSITVALDNVGMDDDIPFMMFWTHDGANANSVLDTVNVVGTLNANAEDGLFTWIELGHNVQTLNLNTDVDMVVLEVENDGVSTNEVTTFNAANSRGDIIYFVDDFMQTLIGGMGDDVFIFGEDGPDLWNTIDGGEGFNMVVVGNNVFQTQDYDALNQMSNIQALGFEGDNVQLDAGQVAGFNAFLFGDINDNDRNFAQIRNLSEDQLVAVYEEDDLLVVLENAAADATFEVEAGSMLDIWISGATANSKGATGGTLTLLGEGHVDYDNAVSITNAPTWIESQLGANGLEITTGANGKYSTIDATLLSGHFDLFGMAAGVTETVLLGASDSWIYLDVVFNDASSSSIGNLDVISGFDADSTALAGFDTVQNHQLGSNVTTLQQAFASAAAAYEADLGEDINVLVFQFGGDTYLYADTITDDGAGRYDNGDFALKVLGLHDIEVYQEV